MRGWPLYGAGPGDIQSVEGALVTPAVLIGVLGYAIGNYAGVGMAFLLRTITG